MYTQGGCYGLHEVLKEVFPDADAFYDPVEGHVYTKIDGAYYDINGKARPPLDKLVRMRDDKDLMRKVHRWKPNYKFLPG